MPVLKPKKKTALELYVESIKATDKATINPAKTLQKIIDDYCMTKAFDTYIQEHADDVARYLKPDLATRPGMWRASAAGKCVQEQAFNKVAWWEGRFERSPAQPRTPENMRALSNGTFGHVRWHLLFDALHDLGLVRTLAAEELRYYAPAMLSGTVDRVIEFLFQGVWIRAVIDFKTMKTTYFNPLMVPSTENAMQQQAYSLFGFDAPWWMMLYECKDTHKLKVFALKVDEIMVGKLLSNYKQATEWYDAVRRKMVDAQLPKLPLITDWCRFCDWNKACKKLNPERDGKAVH